MGRCYTLNNPTCLSASYKSRSWLDKGCPSWDNLFLALAVSLLQFEAGSNVNMAVFPPVSDLVSVSRNDPSLTRDCLRCPPPVLTDRSWKWRNALASTLSQPAGSLTRSDGYITEDQWQLVIAGDDRSSTAGIWIKAGLFVCSSVWFCQSDCSHGGIRGEIKMPATWTAQRCKNWQKKQNKKTSRYLSPNYSYLLFLQLFENITALVLIIFKDWKQNPRNWRKQSPC